MPPPKARPKSHSDTSEELRKNLMDCGGSSSCDNSFFQEELHKYFKENEESEFKRIDDELSISKSNESFLNEKSTNYYNSNNIPNQINSPSINSLNNNLTAENNFFNNCNNNNNISYSSNNINNNNNNNANNHKSLVNSFNFNMVNYLYNDLSVSENNEESSQEYKKSLEKLKLNLAKDSRCYNKFVNLPTPGNNKEIKLFVENLERYISEHLFDNNFKNLQIKLQTRYNDYKNKGLNFEYFKDTLERMQKELISRISKQNNGDKKIESGNYDFLYLFLKFV